MTITVPAGIGFPFVAFLSSSSSGIQLLDFVQSNGYNSNYQWQTSDSKKDPVVDGITQFFGILLPLMIIGILIFCWLGGTIGNDDKDGDDDTSRSCYQQVKDFFVFGDMAYSGNDMNRRNSLNANPPRTRSDQKYTLLVNPGNVVSPIHNNGSDEDLETGRNHKTSSSSNNNNNNNNNVIHHGHITQSAASSDVPLMAPDESIISVASKPDKRRARSPPPPAAAQPNRSLDNDKELDDRESSSIDIPIASENVQSEMYSPPGIVSGDETQFDTLSRIELSAAATTTTATDFVFVEKEDEVVSTPVEDIKIPSPSPIASTTTHFEDKSSLNVTTGTTSTTAKKKKKGSKTAAVSTSSAPSSSSPVPPASAALHPPHESV